MSNLFDISVEEESSSVEKQHKNELDTIVEIVS